MNLIDQIKSNITITELVTRLGLFQNKSGFISSIYKKEKVPSLKIYPDTNSYFDFSTDTGGDVIKFYEDYYHIETKQAIQELAKMLNLKTESNYYSSPKAITPPKQLLELLPFELYYFDERAGIYEFEAGLTKTEAEKYAYQDLTYQRTKIQKDVYSFLYRESALTDAAISYLTSNKRKLTKETIERFKLFSLGEHSESLLRDSFLEDVLIISGLFSRNGKYLFDEHTLIIPYQQGGKIVSLKGRYFVNSEHEPPEGKIKYKALSNFAGNLNAKRFFNIDTLNGHTGEIVITEGEFDCMIAEQLGDKALGVPGVSNFPFELISMIAPYEIYLCFDNDKAGKDATAKTKAILEKEINKPVHIIKLTNGKDLTEVLCQ